MITDEKINRINELARKEKANPGSLTEEELAERAQLRREYIDAVKENMRSRLDNVKYVEDLTKEEKARLKKTKGLLRGSVKKANKKKKRESR